MELKRLRYFLCIASEGSLTRASDALGVAQPALGRQMQMLESELGVKLFYRTSTGMQLTTDGDYLKRALDNPVKWLDTVLHNVKAAVAPMHATLVLGLPPAIAEFFGPRVVSRLQQDLPGVRLKIVEGKSTELAADLTQGKVDIAILAGDAPPEAIFHVDILRETLVLVVPAKAALASNAHIQFDQLAKLPLILPSTQAGLRIKLTKAGLAAQISFNIVMEIDPIELAKRAVLFGHGFAILPPLAFKTEADRGELKGVPIIQPQMDQIVRWAVRPNTGIPRPVYAAVEYAVFDEWFAAVARGDWPATWLFDLDQLHYPATQPPGGPECDGSRGANMGWHRF